MALVVKESFLKEILTSGNTGCTVVHKELVDYDIEGPNLKVVLLFAGDSNHYLVHYSETYVLDPDIGITLEFGDIYNKPVRMLQDRHVPYYVIEEVYKRTKTTEYWEKRFV